MTRVAVSVEFEWLPIGEVQLEDQRLRFPTVADVPGAYRFELTERVYVGETDRLRRRFQHYRTPGPSQSTNLRLNALIRERLAVGEIVQVHTLTTARVDTGCGLRPLDLATKPARLLVENAALVFEEAAGMPFENM